MSKESLKRENSKKNFSGGREMLYKPTDMQLTSSNHSEGSTLAPTGSKFAIYN